MFFSVFRPIRAILSFGLLTLLIEASRPQSDEDVFRELFHVQSAGAVQHGEPSEAEKLAAAAINEAEKKAVSEHLIDDQHEKEKEAEAKSASPAEASPAEAGPTAGSPADASPEEASAGSPADASPEEASVGSPAGASPEEASAGSPADASPEEASPANTTPAEASPQNASPSAVSPASTSPAEASSVNTSPREESPASSSQEEGSQEIASPTEGSSADAMPAIGSDESPSAQSHQPTEAVGSAAATSGDRNEFNNFHALGTQADELHLRVATVTTGEGGGLAKKASGRAANAYKVIGAYQESLEKLKLGLQANLRKHMEDLAQNMVKDLKHQDDAWKSTLGFEVPKDLKAAEAWDGLPGPGHVSSAPAPAELSEAAAEASPPASSGEKVTAVEASPPASSEEKVATVEAHTAEELHKKVQELARLCEGKDRIMNDEDCVKAESRLEAKNGDGDSGPSGVAGPSGVEADDLKASQAKKGNDDSELVTAMNSAEQHDGGPSGAERDDLQAAAPALPDDEVAAVEKAIQQKLNALEDLCKDSALTEKQCKEKRDVILAEKDEQLAGVQK